jgi:hypothetical protein
MTQERTGSETLRDMFGNEIRIGDTLLCADSGRQSTISVIEVTGIKAGVETNRFFEKTTRLHLFGRPAGSERAPVWIKYPGRTVNITGTDVVTHFNLWKGLTN